MGAYLDRPVTEKETEDGTVDVGDKAEQKGLPFAVSSMQVGVPECPVSYHSP